MGERAECLCKEIMAGKTWTFKIMHFISPQTDSNKRYSIYKTHCKKLSKIKGKENF